MAVIYYFYYQLHQTVRYFLTMTCQQAIFIFFILSEIPETKGMLNAFELFFYTEQPSQAALFNRVLYYA